jgi:hypothetical protein
MNFGYINTSLDLSPVALFPNHPAAAQDKKCVVIANVIRELAQFCDMSTVTQVDVQNNAQKRYAFLSQTNKSSLMEVDHDAYLLYQQGVSVDTVREYYSFRLSEQDAKKWTIIIC